MRKLSSTRLAARRLRLSRPSSALGAGGRGFPSTIGHVGLRCFHQLAHWTLFVAEAEFSDLWHVLPQKMDPRQLDLCMQFPWVEGRRSPPHELRPSSKIFDSSSPPPEMVLLLGRLHFREATCDSSIVITLCYSALFTQLEEVSCSPGGCERMLTVK